MYILTNLAQIPTITPVHQQRLVSSAEEVAKNFVTAKAISRDDLDRRLFLKTLAEACEETD